MDINGQGRRDFVLQTYIFIYSHGQIHKYREKITSKQISAYTLHVYVHVMTDCF